MSDLKVLSLGAGVQSTTLLLMALGGEIERPDCAIFSDTGWEPQKVYSHLERLKDEASRHDFPIHIVSIGNIRSDILRQINTHQKWVEGQPPLHIINRNREEDGGKLWRQCTNDYKIEPINRKIKDLLGYKPWKHVKKRGSNGTYRKYADQWIGISTDEAQRMRSNKVKWITNVYPLVDMHMTRQHCVQWLQRRGWGDTPKSACIGCPLKGDKRWRSMKKHAPEEFHDAVSFDSSLRERPYPGAKGMAYVHRSMVPLGEVDLTTDRDHGQMDMFGEECEGMCGV